MRGETLSGGVPGSLGHRDREPGARRPGVARVLAAAQAFWAECNQGQSPCSSVTVTYFDGPVLATDEPLHNGEASIGYPASSFHGAPVSQPCDLRFGRLLAGRSPASAGRGAGRSGDAGGVAC